MHNPPTHVAIIPDGNRRWAKKKGLPPLEGHRRGFAAMVKIGKKLRQLGIQTLTVWAFSTENWKRDTSEVDYLMKIYELWIKQNLKDALKDKVRILHLGRRDRIPKSLLGVIDEAVTQTAHFNKFYLCVALDYGGRDEILRAAKKISTINPSTDGQMSNLTEEEFEKFLDTKDLPHPNVDLVIRTSGEERTSGFLPWQTAYSEYIFVENYLPDFTPAGVVACLEEYSRRKRRFGR